MDAYCPKRIVALELPGEWKLRFQGRNENFSHYIVSGSPLPQNGRVNWSDYASMRACICALSLPNVVVPVSVVTHLIRLVDCFGHSCSGSKWIIVYGVSENHRRRAFQRLEVNEVNDSFRSSYSYWITTTVFFFFFFHKPSKRSITWCCHCSCNNPIYPRLRVVRPPTLHPPSTTKKAQVVTKSLAITLLQSCWRNTSVKLKIKNEVIIDTLSLCV